MRYNALNPYLREKFGEKVYKITLGTNVTCPNRDGTKGTGGCIYCNPKSFLPEYMEIVHHVCHPRPPLSRRVNSGGDPVQLSALDSRLPAGRHGFRGNDITSKTTSSQIAIDGQLKAGIEYAKRRHGAKKFISYFQQHTNTYAPVQNLSSWFHQAIDHPDIVGLAISTRPDCVDREVVKLLSELNKETFLWVELGLQTANDKRLKFLNRGHTVQDFIDSTERLHDNDIDTCAHVMLGLPDETDEEILNTAGLLNELNVKGVKIHNLHILKNTPLEKLYNNGEIKLPSLEGYAKKVALMIENLDPKILIHRFNSHAPRRLTVAPAWSVNKLATFNAIEDELERQDTWQGRKIINQKLNTENTRG